jgi:TP901 family phage tail tape measure protein
MARAIEVPVVAKRGTLAKSIEGEAAAAFRSLGRSSGAVAPLGRMLGKIRADADEFTKSIEASNARVIAFGASVGVINGISNAFKSLVATTINVEKKLTDINIVLGASQKGIAKFGDGLFKVAKNTAQSFDVVAEAATEFARQGLSIEETLKRTNDALILTRLTGLKAAESVKGLTAAVNGFGKAGLTTTQIINKLSAVDVQFAVGTDDLIDALSRAGAVAQDAGVNFDELVALVTVAGAVIGNAFKTIYTRIQDPKALAALRQVGIAVDDITGAALPANRVLQNLAQSYDTLNRTQKATIDQFVAGKFQINILKSVLGDLKHLQHLQLRVD